MTEAAPARPGPAPRTAPQRVATAVQASAPAVQLAFSTLESASERGKRVALYGTGGVGKTTLALAAAVLGTTAFFDLDDSLVQLRDKVPADRLRNIRTINGVDTFEKMRGLLNAKGWDGIRNIVIDSFTRAEELAVAMTLRTVPISNERNAGFAKNIEGYGYGKGYQNVFDTFLPIFADLDKHAAAGRNIILICHECTTNVPNPRGEDFIRYEPRMQSPSSGKGSIRLRLKEWCDDMIFCAFDIDVQDGVAKASGSRTAYPMERPFCMAKSRSLPDQDLIIAKDDPAFWHFLKR